MKTQNVSRVLAIAALVMAFGACTKATEPVPEVKAAEETGSVSNATAPASVEGTVAAPGMGAANNQPAATPDVTVKKQ